VGVELRETYTTTAAKIIPGIDSPTSSTIKMTNQMRVLMQAKVRYTPGGMFLRAIRMISTMSRTIVRLEMPMETPVAVL
jgi:hypothetical protein